MNAAQSDTDVYIAPLEFAGDETAEQIRAIVADYMAAHVSILQDQREELEREFDAREADLEARPEAANDNDPAGVRGAPLPVINPADWHGKPVPARQWFLDGLIPSRTVTILAGDGGVGKSLLALQLAAASAMGVDTIGLSPVRCRVTYLGAEDEADEFHRRLVDIAGAHSRTLADLGNLQLIPMADRDALLAIPDSKGVMQPTQNWTALRARILRHGPGLIVLDTSADLYGGDEIKRAQVRGFIAMLRALALEADAAVLLLSHPSITGMQSGSGSSGSTAWNNSVRSRLYLTVPKGEGIDPRQRVLTVMKANYGETGDGLALRWQAGCFAADDGRPTEEIAFVTKRHDEVFLTVLRKFVAQGVNVSANTGPTYAPSKIAGQPEAKGIGRKQLTDALQRLLDGGQIRMVTEGPASRQRSRLVVSQ